LRLVLLDPQLVQNRACARYRINYSMQSDVTTTRDDAPGGGRDGPVPNA
jgi:hypothetical protein